MTIKLLTHKEKEELLKDFIKEAIKDGSLATEYIEKQWIAGYYKDGHYTEGYYKEISRRKRTKQELVEAAELLLRDLEYQNGAYYVELNDFPDCCGAAVMCGFPYRNASKQKFSERDKLVMILAVNRCLDPTQTLKYPFIFAILNEHQQKKLKPIFERFGGEMVALPKVGFHKFKIYPWLFIRSNRVKKQKRTFS